MNRSRITLAAAVLALAFVQNGLAQPLSPLPTKTCYQVQTSPGGTMWVIQYKTSESGPWIDWRTGISSRSQAEWELWWNVEHGQFPENAVNSRFVERPRPASWTTVAEFESPSLAHRHARQISRTTDLRVRVNTVQKLITINSAQLPRGATPHLTTQPTLRVFGDGKLPRSN